MNAPNPEARALVLRLREEGLRPSEIAGVTGLSKNSVVGFLHRANFGGVGRDRAVMRLAATSVLPPARGRRDVFPIRHKVCQFIAGERGRDFQTYLEPGVFCGAPTQAGSPYCPEHHRKTRKRGAALGAAKPKSEFVPPARIGSANVSWR